MSGLAWAGLFSMLQPGALAAEAVDVAPLVERINEVGTHGKGHREAIAAWQRLVRADSRQIASILAGMKDSGPLAENWIRAAVEAIAERRLEQGGPLPVAALEAFLGDVQQSPRARRLAYELVDRVDDSAESRLIPTLLHDPSLELRRDAVARALLNAEQLREQGKRSEAIEEFRKVFHASRDLDQIKQASRQLGELDQPVNLPRHMGFVKRWHVIGSFDNTDGRGFDTVYTPEREVDLTAAHQGKLGEVAWREHTTDDDYGVVDLNVILNRPKEGNEYALTDAHKGAVAYAYSEFHSNGPRDVDLRIGCINANKVWLNGQLITANEVYHANTEVDQYVGKGRLKAGKNTILVKICQNEQTENWAQRWQFQLRVCDEIGTAVLSEDRPAP